MDALAERSKAVAQGAIPQGRGLEPHRRQRSGCKTHTAPLHQFVYNITSRSKHGCDTQLKHGLILSQRTYTKPLGTDLRQGTIVCTAHVVVVPILLMALCVHLS